MNNMLIELKRQKLKQEFMELQEQDIDTQQPLKNSQEFNKSYGVGKMLKKSAITNGEMESSPALLNPSPVETKDLELQDTEDPEIKQGIKSNGVKYSVRTNRKRFFFPDEWKLFLKSLEKRFTTIKQLMNVDSQAKLGAKNK